MDKALVVVALLAIVIVFNWRASRLAKRAVDGRANAEALRVELTVPVRFFSLAVSPSFFAAVMVASWEDGEATNFVWPVTARVLVGSALVMELASRCAGNRKALEEPIPELVGLRAMRGLFTSVAAQFFWAAVGLAVLFGGAADRQLASILAFDCAMLGAMFALAYHSRRRRWERSVRGFCDELDPLPDGAPNMTDLTRSFPIVPREYTSIRAHQDGRIELGQRLPGASTIPIIQGVVLTLSVIIAVMMVFANLRAAALGALVTGGAIVALLTREKRRPHYRVVIDTTLREVCVTLPRIDARPERFVFAEARQELERKDEEGYPTMGRLLLTLGGGKAHHELLDWVAYPKALEAARALAIQAGLPLDRDGTPGLASS